MSLLTRMYSAVSKRDLTQDLLLFMGLPHGFGSTSLSRMQAMQLSAVYRCVDVLSDAMATPTIEVQERVGPKGWMPDPDQPLWQLLNLEPNPSMSAHTMRKLMMSKVLLDGNAYVEIIRDAMGNPWRLQLILDYVKILRDPSGILYYVIQSSQPRILEQSDVIHLLNFTYDGLIGVSTLTHASNTLTTYDAHEKYAKGFFYGGGTGSVVVKVATRIDGMKAAEIKQQFMDAQSPTDGAPGSVVVHGSDMELQQFPSIPPRDAQMLESRQFEVVDICRFFGVDPVKVYETKDSKYNTVESMQLAYLTDTISPHMHRQETELNRKLFLPSQRSILRCRFDEEELLRADLNSRSNYRMKQFQIGAFTVDDNREAVGKPPFETELSQSAWVQVNMKAINKPQDEGNGNGSPQPGSGTEPNPDE